MSSTMANEPNKKRRDETMRNSKNKEVENMKRIGRALIMALAVLGTCLISGTVMADAAQRVAGMDRVKVSDDRYRMLFGDDQSTLSKTDADFFNTMKRFIYGDAASYGKLSIQQSEMIVLAILATNQEEELFIKHVEAALKVGATPIEIKETIYQAAPYVGFPKAVAALKMINTVFERQGIRLPIENQTRVTEGTRFEKGLAVQKAIFGDVINKGYEDAPDDLIHIQEYLSAFCFGDTYTRGGMDIKMRELITLSVITALGGCENQLKAHVQANLNVGNDRGTILSAVTACLPYIGFPRALNAISCVNQVAPPTQK